MFDKIYMAGLGSTNVGRSLREMDSIVAVIGTIVGAIIGSRGTYLIARSTQLEARKRINEIETRVARSYSHLVRRLFRMIDGKRHFAETYPPYTRQDAIDAGKVIIEALKPLERACDDQQLFLQLSAAQMDALSNLLENINTYCAIIDIDDFKAQFKRSMSLSASECNSVLETLGVDRQKTHEQNFESLRLVAGSSPQSQP